MRIGRRIREHGEFPKKFMLAAMRDFVQQAGFKRDTKI
jgi:hypothetical protein